MKKILAVLFAALMLFSFTACRDGGNADLEAMKAQMKLMQQQLDEAKQAGFNPSGENAPAPESTPAPAPAIPSTDSAYVIAINSTIGGETLVPVDGSASFTAEAIIPEGMAVQNWEVNGAPYYEDMEPTFAFTADGYTVVEARLRPEFKVTTTNAQMQFLNAKGKPKGEPFTEFVFEEDYENPVTKETMPGGHLSSCNVCDGGTGITFHRLRAYQYDRNYLGIALRVYDITQAIVIIEINLHCFSPSS